MTTSTTTAAIVSDRQQVIRQAEFSLVNFTPNQNTDAIIVGRLRFPPGCARDTIREIIALLVQHEATIVSQQCVGDRNATTGWSSLVFDAPVRTYQQLIQTARPSNLKVVRENTEMLLLSLLTASVEKATSTEETDATVEAKPVVATEPTVKSSPTDESESLVELAQWLVISDTKHEASDSDANIEFTSTVDTQAASAEDNSSSTIATQKQLNSLTLSKLKELASRYNIQGRSSMTKNLEIARQKLVPKLVGLVTVAEL